MTTGHYITNKGKFLLLQGAWVDNTVGQIKMGYIQATPSSVSGAADAAATAAVVAQWDTVQNLITAGGTLATFTNYAPTALTTPALTEQDTPNNRVILTASGSPWTIATAGGATNNTLHGVFFYDITAGDTAGTQALLSVDFFASTITTNGGSLSYSWTNIYTAA